MKLGPVIHQQIVQLKWHVLACLGLVMALPLEEAVTNAWQGEGFYVGRLSLFIPIIAAPLLAGLIACANVQADLDDKRYLFWRSRPAGVKTFMSIKFLIGMVTALIIIACPFVFAFVTCQIVQTEKNEREFFVVIAVFQLISLLTYSVCFFCNVLIRKTARAWLVGMAAACLMMVLPFILPFHFKDIVGDVLVVTSAVYLSITIGSSALAFALSLVAADRNWHLHTNLKGLLWAGAAVVFLLAMLFSRQVANIKVLDEIEHPRGFTFAGNFKRFDSFTEEEHHILYVDISENKIKLKNVYAEPFEETAKLLEGAKQLYSVGEKGLGLDRYPRFDRIYFDNGSDTFLFQLNTYYHEEDVGKRSYQRKYKKAFLCGYKLLEGLYRLPVSSLDLSDCYDEEGTSKVGLWQIEDKLIVLIQDSIAVVQIKADGSFEIINKEVYALKGYSRNLVSRDKTFKMPLVPIQDISIEERIKLTIDVNYINPIFSGWRYEEDFGRRSLVDMNGSEISFCLLNEGGIQRYDVIRWDDDYVYCRFRDERPFTFLEQMFGQVTYNDPHFVQNGKLYVFENQKLMVFDVRSERIRKVGHFERLTNDFYIYDIEVLDNGNILLNSQHEIKVGEKKVEGGYHYDYYKRNKNLILLKNPE